MPRNKRDVESGLLAKGFILEDDHHHFFVYWTIDGRKTRARTKTSHTKKHKDIGDNLLSQMAQQCKVTRSQFLDLVDCPMDRTRYESVLVERGELPGAGSSQKTDRKVR
jgi:hypothetical protein